LENGGIVPGILDLETRWKSVVSFTPQLLYPQAKFSRLPIGYEEGWAQSTSENDGEEKNSHPLPGIEP
jgi:hypothetical protein